MKLLKKRVIKISRGEIMRTVFGIDVSKSSSEVAILVNGERVQGYSIPNDVVGFSRLFRDLTQVCSSRNCF
jgi:hypothetical protein